MSTTTRYPLARSAVARADSYARLSRREVKTRRVARERLADSVAAVSTSPSLVATVSSLRRAIFLSRATSQLPPDGRTESVWAMATVSAGAALRWAEAAVAARASRSRLSRIDMGNRRIMV